jgi:hypothetical protein
MRTLATEDGNSLMLEQGGLLVLEGEVVDTIAGLVVTDTGAHWTAYTGATGGYQISIGGGAFSATGITGTTYTGTILPGQTVVVRALDGSTPGNVIAQGTRAIASLIGSLLVIDLI